MSGAWLPYLLVIPILAFEGVFVLYPIVKGILTSFKSQELGATGSFTFSNYSRMFADPVFWQVVRVTLIFTAAVVVLMLVVGLFIAMLLNWSFRGRGFVRGILAIPWALPDIPVVLTFLLMADPNFGIFNRFASWIPGLGAPLRVFHQLDSGLPVDHCAHGVEGLPLLRADHLVRAAGRAG